MAAGVVAVVALTLWARSCATPPAPSGPMPPPAIGATWTSPVDGMVLVSVPAGEFLMGATDADSQADSSEKPQHKVYLDAFWIDRTEVTAGQYAKCVAAWKCRKPPRCTGAGKDDHPVTCVTWQDAANYCAWAGRRLPTEAEWERAARGTDGRKYPWGNEAPDCARANYAGKDGGCVGGMAAVGSYPAGASPYGALDMAGNVWEWVNDWYDENYYRVSPGSNPQGPATGTHREIRGHSWNSMDIGIGAAARSVGSAPDMGGNDVGFRCAQGTSL
jgi:eukaryotic-like serine/threonine-protein kinase